MLNGRKRAAVVALGTLVALALGSCFFLIIFGLPRWGEAVTSTLWLVPIPVLALLLYTRPERQQLAA